MNNPEKSYIITYTGKKFNLLKPELEMIDFEDIAHAQAMLCRWTGHTRHFYSIAQHAYYCSFIGPDNEALWRLAHDMSESYLGDMSRPLKYYTSAGEAYRRVEWPIQNLIYEACGLSIIEPESVKFADQSMLYTEQFQLLPRVNFDLSDPFLVENRADIIIEEWSPRYAERMFLDRFEKLYNKRIN
jgi:5'-deoxynucleotidase YfbR-like HD superfamily hydrolase